MNESYFFCALLLSLNVYDIYPCCPLEPQFISIAVKYPIVRIFIYPTVDTVLYLVWDNNKQYHFEYSGTYILGDL